MVGIVFFSGPLYVLALTNATWLGAIAPIGGTALIIAWAMILWNPGVGRAPGSGPD